MKRFSIFLSVLLSMSSVATAQDKMRVGFDLSCNTVQKTTDGQNVYWHMNIRTYHSGVTTISNGSSTLFEINDSISLSNHPDSSDFGQISYKSKIIFFNFLSQRLKVLLDKKESSVWFGGDNEKLMGYLEDRFNSYPETFGLFCNGSVFVY